MLIIQVSMLRQESSNTLTEIWRNPSLSLDNECTLLEIMWIFTYFHILTAELIFFADFFCLQAPLPALVMRGTLNFLQCRGCTLYKFESPAGNSITCQKVCIMWNPTIWRMYEWMYECMYESRVTCLLWWTVKRSSPFNFTNVSPVFLLLKEIVSRDGFGFGGHTWSCSSRPKLGTQPVFKYFRCSDDFYNAKSVFLAVNASLCWLNNVSGVYFIQVSLLLVGSRVW